MSTVFNYTKELLLCRVKLRIPNAITVAKVSKARQFTSLGQPERDQIDFPGDNIVVGPRLRHSRFYGENFLPTFKDSGRNCINSVGSIWKPNYNNQPSQHRASAGNKMRCFVQFLSTPTADTPGTTLVLHFDNKRYLIGNVAEGTQRAAVQRKLGLVKVGDIFFTGTIGWGTTGGMLGMILTIADASTTSREESQSTKVAKGRTDTKLEKHWLNIHGGKNLTHLIATARRFVFRKGMPIHTQEFRAGQDTPKPNWAPTWEDDMVKVWAMVIEPEAHVEGSRKRSHDEFATDSTDLADMEKDDTAEDESRNDELRRAVVADMFDSEWRLDALFKKKLSEVKQPAQIFTRNKEGKIEKYTGPMPSDGEDVPDIEVLVRNPWPGAMIDNLPPTTPSKSSICYVMKNHPQRGKFDPKAAIKLGVPKGPAFSKLTHGQSVTLEDGTVITPEQVLGPTKEGTGFAVIELPTTSYIESLLCREEWSSKEVMSGVGIVVWILGPGVVADSRLLKFMEDHSEIEHIVSSQDVCSNFLALESPASAAIRLHLLDPERFPIPVHSNSVQSLVRTDLPFERARVGKTFLLEPRFEIQDDKIIQYLDTAKVVEEASPEVQELADAALKEVTSEEYLARLNEHQQNIPSKDAEVITLGTGSALPSKYRNVSATLLRVPGYGSYLFDCGENTIGQLKRVFGKELPEVLRDLKVIWISHLHADHHLGTASVIKAWHEETQNDPSTNCSKLVVASDNAMLYWLEEYSSIEEYGYERVQPIMINARTNVPYSWYFDEQQKEKIGLVSIRACPVSHCNGALAVVLNFPNGFKVAYSGDCRPSREFAQIGKDATLLIHEATFDDELQGDAYAKKHSTTAEAIEVGRQMNARRILLTHFSQRYQKIPVMESREGKAQVVIVAFDYMRVKIGDIAKVEAFKPALMKLFEEKDKEVEETL